METAIETAIRKFVFEKIQEQITLDVSKSKQIAIKPKSKHGSIAIAMFWLRVLRHKNNYPMPNYPYKDVYDKQGNNKIILKVDDVTISVLMTSGLLTIQGMFVLEWFLNTFEKIMAAYDAPVGGPQPQTITYRQYTENWKRIQTDGRNKEEEERRQIREKEDHAVSVLEDRERIIKELRTMQTESSNMDKDLESAKEDSDGEMKLKVDIEESEAEKVSRAAEEAAEEEKKELDLVTEDLWPEDVLKVQLKQIRTGRVRDGSTYVYKLWLSLLSYWFSDPDRRVYIVTPDLDAQRLYDICKLVVDHRIEAKLDALYVLQQCDHQRRISEVQLGAIEKFEDPYNQMFIEYKVFSALVYPLKRFNAKFVASVKDNRAEVLVTSASFHGDHFARCSMETVHYEVMSEAEFLRVILAPINATA